MEAIMFFMALGIVTAINYLVASKAKDEALKILGFVLLTSVGIAVVLQWYTYPPDRIVWRLAADLLLVIFLLKYKYVFASRPLLAVFSVSTYLSMAMVNLWTLLGKGEALVALEMVSDAMFVLLLITCLWMGGRRAYTQLGSGDNHRRGDLHAHRHRYPGE